MFNNVNAKKRLTQVIVAFMVICMTLTGSFLLLDDTISTVYARDEYVSTQVEWNNFMSQAKSGETWNLTLDSNITISSVTGGKFAAVPSGVTVNLDMNNCSIIWDYVHNANSWNGNLMAGSYTSGTYANGEYWGLLTNNGTLNIQGTGTIRNKKIHIAGEKVGDHDEAVQKLATIVNNGNLTVGGNVTVEAYLTSVHNDNRGWAQTQGTYSDSYLYNSGIYSSSGTVNSSAKIYVGGLTGHSQTGTNGRSYDLCYGIYGDGSSKVNVTGGSIYVDSFAGGFVDMGSGDSAHMYSSAVGVFGNNTLITGNTTINVLTKNWRQQKGNGGNSIWKNGIDHNFSAGVMYTGENYPVVGPSVDIVASFEHVGNSNTQIYVPGHEGLFWSDVSSENASNNTSHVATPIAGVSAVRNNIGNHNSEKEYNNDGGFFGNSSAIDSITKTAYRTVQSYYSGSNTTVNATKMSNTNNDHVRYSSAIVNGAPGSTVNNGGVTSANKGVPGAHSPAASSFKKGSQYLVVYRFYKDVNNIESVSFTPDTRVDSPATINVGGTSNDKSGIIPDSASKIAHAGGAESKNAKFYSFEGAHFETVESANSGFTNRLNDIASGKATTPANWAGSKGILPNGGIELATDKDNTIIIYLDYKKLEATPIKVVAANAGTPITEYTDTTKFTVPYTGAPLKPGTDFNLGILDVANSNNVITNVYNISGSGSGSGNNATAVTYRYSSDGKTWNNGLPQNVGTYKIEVSVNADTTYAASGTYNRQGKQQLIDCTITPANVTISGPTSKTVVYGSAFGEIFDFNEYTAKNKNGAVVKGTWSLTGVTLSTVPNAGSYESLRIVWTPDVSEGNNYGTTEYPVTLIVNKRAVTVNAGTATVTYGDAAPSFTVKYNNVAAADESKQAGWLASTVFEVNYNGTWREYYQGMPAGTYDLRIKSFGGAADTNNTFTTNSATDKLTVEKRAIKYTATATDKTYDEKINVAVTLTNPTNNYTPDVFDSTINVTGTMVNANAGNGKAVTVATENVTIQHSNNYYLVIDNAATLTVNVAKYTPKNTDVSVIANIEGSSIVYGEAKTLSAIALKTVNENIDGTWSWKTADAKPTVGQTSYVAVFTPKDTTNYNSIEQNVNLTVEQADVTVTVAPITVTYGAPVPVLKLEYNGFVFGETLDNIEYEGNAEVSTDYTPGSGVRETPYTISVKSNLASENYNFIVENSTITVKAKALTVTTKNFEITYGDPVPIFSASDVIPVTELFGNDTLASISTSISATTNYINNANNGKVGTYKINPNVVLKNANYTISYDPGTLTVGKAVLTVIPLPQTIPFGSNIPDYEIAGTDYDVKGFKYNDKLSDVTTDKPDFTTSYTSGSYVNSYPVTAVTTGMHADNYTFEGASGTINVVKAMPTVKTAPTATVVNSHSLADAVFSTTAVVVNENNGANVSGTFTFVNTTDVIAWAGPNTTKVCDAIFTPNDTYNYTTKDVKITVTVTVKNISGTPVIQGSAMAGSTLTVSLAAMDPTTASSYTYQWYVGNTPVATSDKYVVRTEDIGKTIYVVLDAVESNGFTGNATSEKTDAVIKALLETTAEHLKVVFAGVEYTDLGIDTTFASVVYDDMSHAGTVAIADGYNANYFGTPVLKYNGSTEAPTKAGTYVVTVDVSTPKEPDGGYPENTYYGPATGIAVGTITITRAPYTVTVLANDKPYDGTATATATISGSGLKGDDKVTLSEENVRYTFADTNAGKDIPIIVSNVALIGGDAANYEIVIKETTASITPRVIYFRAKGVDKIYDGSNHVDVTFEYDALENSRNSDWGYAPVDNAATIYLTNGTAVATNVNAGEGIPLSAINGDPAGSSEDNYEVRISNANSATVIIKRAPVSVVAPVINGVVYDSTKPLNTISLDAFETDNGYWQFDDTTIVPTVKQKTYAATYYSKNDNYEKETPGTITVNVTPKEVILTADSKSVVYGANAPTYTITATGFTGTDSLSMIGGNITIESTYAPGSDIENIYDITIKESLTRDNYTFVTVKGFLTVTPRVLNVTATAKDKVYDGNSNITVEFSKLTADAGVFVNDLGKINLSYDSITGSAKSSDAGTTTVNYAKPVLLGEKAKNYQLNITPNANALTVVISKADVYGVVFPTDATVEFGYDLTHVVFGEPGIGDGTFAYENAAQVVPGLPSVYDTYKVIFTPTDSKNYNTQEAYVSLQVIKCVLDYTVGIAGNPQSGQTLTVVATNLPSAALGYMTYQWYRVTDDGQYIAIKGANEKSYVATDADVGYTLAVRTAIIEGSPFLYAEGADTEVIEDIKGFVGETTSAIKEITLTFWQRLMNWLYRILAILTGIQLGGGLLGG